MGRADYVRPTDVDDVAVDCLSHRVIALPSLAIPVRELISQLVVTYLTPPK
jgi:hypothetical protein